MHGGEGTASSYKRISLMTKRNEANRKLLLSTVY